MGFAWQIIELLRLFANSLVVFRLRLRFLGLRLRVLCVGNPQTRVNALLKIGSSFFLWHSSENFLQHRNIFFLETFLKILEQKFARLTFINKTLRNSTKRNPQFYAYSAHKGPLRNPSNRNQNITSLILAVIFLNSSFLFFDCTHVIKWPSWCQNNSKMSPKFCITIKSNFRHCSFHQRTWPPWDAMKESTSEHPHMRPWTQHVLLHKIRIPTLQNINF